MLPLFCLNLLSLAFKPIAKYGRILVFFFLDNLAFLSQLGKLERLGLILFFFFWIWKQCTRFFIFIFLKMYWLVYLR